MAIIRWLKTLNRVGGALRRFIREASLWAQAAYWCITPQPRVASESRRRWLRAWAVDLLHLPSAVQCEKMWLEDLEMLKEKK